jgi:hypothetical protein
VRHFVYVRKSGEPSNPAGMARVMTVAAARVVQGSGPFRLRRNEDDAGPERSRAEVLRRLRKQLTTGSVGDFSRVYSATVPDEALLRAREVQPSLDVIDINGNDRADVYYSTILQEFPQYRPRYAGSYVCKDIAGTSELSQHSYGNAVDFFFDSLAHQDAVAAWVVAHADELHVEHVISRNRIWSRGQGWHAYTGDYHSHLHVDLSPQYFGPCGVRG